MSPLLSAQAPTEDKRWQIVGARMRRLGGRPDALIETLHTVQSLFGHVDDDAIRYVTTSLGVPLSRGYGVATFYSFFALRPRAEHTCVVCVGTACYITGARLILDAIEERLSPETTVSGRLSLVSARCMGVCSMAPVVVVDEAVNGEQTAEGVYKVLEALL